MKKILYLILALILVATGSFYYFSDTAEPFAVIHSDNKKAAAVLKKAFKQAGKGVKVVSTTAQQSGRFNLYVAPNLSSLPKVVDANAINLLWLPFVAETDNPEVLRPFDVVVVKSPAAFRHLRAINVRTAYLPDAFEIPQISEAPQPNGKALFWENTAPQLIALPAELKNSPQIDKVKRSAPSKNDFAAYSVILFEQELSDLEQETLGSHLIETVSNGGLPFILYNNGVERMFRDLIPMYRNEAEFRQGLNILLNNPQEVLARKKLLRQAVQNWTSQTQAQKLVEIFEIMEKKRR